MKTTSFGVRVIALLDAVLIAATASMHAATISVTNTNDSGPGSLRAVLASASGGDTIDASGISGIIKLTSGELVVSNSVTILGLGPGTLAVDGNASTRVFHITNAVTAVISGLTITNGAVSGAYPVDVGGGIWNDHSTLTVSNCAISRNSGGGGIFNDGRLTGSATLSVWASTLSGNSAVNSGGGIWNDGSSGGSATLSVSTSTFSGNSANSGGSGIYNSGQSGSATLSVKVSTFSGNSTSNVGGGIWNDGGFSGSATLRVNASTFNGNTANQGGGNIYNSAPSGGATAEFGDTILRAGGLGGNLLNNFPATVTSRGYNLSSDNAGFLLAEPTDQINTDPMLGPLADNGGPTFTHALLPGSPAFDRGKRDAILSLALNTDQRGLLRPVDDPCIANASGGDGSDVGAFEVQEVCDFRITAIRRETNNVRVTWQTPGGKTNIVEATAGSAGGGFTNNFTGLATNFIPGTNLTTTNYLDLGGATNNPARYYRVRLVP